MSEKEDRAGLPAWLKVAIFALLTVGILGALLIPPFFAGTQQVLEREDQRTSSGRASPLDTPQVDQIVLDTETVTRIASSSPPPRVRRRPPPPIALGSADVNGGLGGRPGRPGDAAGGPPGAEEWRRPENGGGAAGGDTDPTSLRGQLEGGVATPARAAVATTIRNRDYLIESHAHIPCLPVEVHTTGLGGLVTCQTQDWVAGATGRIGLLPPGTKIKGQIRGGMMQGQQQIGVLYTEMSHFQQGFKIPVHALATSAMGQSGLDANVKTFFWENAAQVGLYALIQGAANAIPNAAGALAGREGAGGNLIYNFASQPAHSLSGMAFQQFQQRRPQAERPEAIPAFVVVAQDLDFARSCSERRQTNRYACPVL